MAWTFQLKVWIKDGKHYVECCACHGYKKHLWLNEHHAPVPEGAEVIRTYERDNYDRVTEYWIPCDACSAKGYQLAQITFEDYKTGVPVDSTGKFILTGSDT